MKCQKLVIETDGTTANTKVFVDGVQVGLLQRIEFSADVRDKFVKLNAIVAKQIDGNIKVRKVKIRDFNTEKFVETDMPVTEPLLIEFVREDI